MIKRVSASQIRNEFHEGFKNYETIRFQLHLFLLPKFTEIFLSELIKASQDAISSFKRRIENKLPHSWTPQKNITATNLKVNTDYSFNIKMW